MTSPTALHDALVTRLRDAVVNVDVYDNDVPDDLPHDPATGRVTPYAVVWAAPGVTDDTARTLCGGADGALDWSGQVTVAAGTPSWCLAAAHAVRSALDGRRLIPTAGLLLEEPSGPATVQKDTDVTPPRYFVPLLFRTQTA